MVVDEQFDTIGIQHLIPKGTIKVEILSQNCILEMSVEKRWASWLVLPDITVFVVSGVDSVMFTIGY